MFETSICNLLVFIMHLTWFIVHGLVSECTEGCCEVCTVPVEVVDHP